MIARPIHQPLRLRGRPMQLILLPPAQIPRERLDKALRTIEQIGADHPNYRAPEEHPCAPTSTAV